jgi:hypothetical protein
VKLFHFYRVIDASGVSGTGPVVEGVEFTNGWCAIRWISDMSSICFYRSLEDLKAIHGHGGGTEIIVHDFQPLQKRQSPLGKSRFDDLMEVIEEVSRITVLAEEPRMARELMDSIARVRILIDRIEWAMKRPPV